MSKNPKDEELVSRALQGKMLRYAATPMDVLIEPRAWEMFWMYLHPTKILAQTPFFQDATRFAIDQMKHFIYHPSHLRGIF